MSDSVGKVDRTTRKPRTIQEMTNKTDECSGRMSTTKKKGKLLKGEEQTEKSHRKSHERIS
jgi:hypothetical protein